MMKYRAAALFGGAVVASACLTQSMRSVAPPPPNAALRARGGRPALHDARSTYGALCRSVVDTGDRAGADVASPLTRDARRTAATPPLVAAPSDVAARAEADAAPPAPTSAPAAAAAVDVDYTPASTTMRIARGRFETIVHEQTKESQVLNAVRRAPTRAKQLDLLLQWRAESRRQIEDNDAAEQRRANRDLELKVSR